MDKETAEKAHDYDLQTRGQVPLFGASHGKLPRSFFTLFFLFCAVVVGLLSWFSVANAKIQPMPSHRTDPTYLFTRPLCDPVTGFKSELKLANGLLKVAGQGAMSTAFTGELGEMVTITSSTKALIESDGYWDALEDCYGVNEPEWLAFTSSILLADWSWHLAGYAYLASAARAATPATTAAKGFLGWLTNNAVRLARLGAQWRLPIAVAKRIKNRIFDERQKRSRFYFETLWGDYLTHPEFVLQARQILDQATGVTGGSVVLYLSDTPHFHTRTEGSSPIFEVPYTLLFTPDPVANIAKVISEALGFSRGKMNSALGLRKRILPSPRLVKTQQLVNSRHLGFGDFVDGIDDKPVYFFVYREHHKPQTAVTACGAEGVEKLFFETPPPCRRVPLGQLLGATFREQKTKSYVDLLKSQGPHLVLDTAKFLVLNELIAQALRTTTLALGPKARLVTNVGIFIFSSVGADYMSSDLEAVVHFEGDDQSQADFLNSFHALLNEESNKASLKRFDSHEFQTRLTTLLRRGGKLSVQALDSSQ